MVLPKIRIQTIATPIQPRKEAAPAEVVLQVAAQAKAPRLPVPQEARPQAPPQAPPQVTPQAPPKATPKTTPKTTPTARKDQETVATKIEVVVVVVVVVVVAMPNVQKMRSVWVV